MTTQVDFYLIPSPAPQAQLDFACKLCDKAWRLGHRIYIHCQDEAQCLELEQRLWSFKGEAFLPHALASEHPEGPVSIGHGEFAGRDQDLLLNLTASIPTFTERFARIAEIVIEEPAMRQAARERFRGYRERGYALQDHRLQRL